MMVCTRIYIYAHTHTRTYPRTHGFAIERGCHLPCVLLRTLARVPGTCCGEFLLRVLAFLVYCPMAWCRPWPARCVCVLIVVASIVVAVASVGLRCFVLDCCHRMPFLSSVCLPPGRLLSIFGWLEPKMCDGHACSLQAEPHRRGCLLLLNKAARYNMLSESKTHRPLSDANSFVDCLASLAFLCVSLLTLDHPHDGSSCVGMFTDRQ